MKKWLVIFLALCCTACSALPAEERAFAVVLCVENDGNAWQVYGRIPAYKAGGEYLTVKGRGTTMDAALADLDAHAPMKVTLSQLRLLVVSAGVDVPGVLQELAHHLDVRPQCVAAVTEESAEKIMAVLLPKTGSRLSKVIDLLIESRVEQGVIPRTCLADAVRMGARETPVLAQLVVQEEQINLSGAWTAGQWLSPEEMQLLSLLKKKAKAVLAQDGRSARVNLRMDAADDLQQRMGESAIAETTLALLTRLAQSGCDVLGLGRKAVCMGLDMEAWPEIYTDIRWEISVGVAGKI